MAIRYIAPSTRQVVGPRDFAALERGVDEYGHFELLPRPTSAFAPEALALYDEVMAAQKAFLYVGAEGA